MGVEDPGESPPAEEGRTLGVDATTLEANAAMRSIVRRDTARATASFSPAWPRPRASRPRRERIWLRSIRSARRKALIKIENIRTTRMPRITKMKDGRTHLALKVGSAVDTDTRAIVGPCPVASASAVPHRRRVRSLNTGARPRTSLANVSMSTHQKEHCSSEKYSSYFVTNSKARPARAPAAETVTTGCWQRRGNRARPA